MITFLIMCVLILVYRSIKKECNIIDKMDR